MKKALLVDDQNIVLLGIAKLLEMSGKIEVVGQLDNGQACIDYLENNPKPDIILLDVHMPEMNGLELIKRIKMRCDTPVIFLTTFDDEYLKQQAIEAGAKGLLLKNIALNELIDSTLKVADGGTLFSAHKICNLSKMTERENCIAKSLVAGKTNKEIAEEQNLSPGTVRNYLSNLFDKLGVRNRSEAVVRLKERGLY
ncbi:MAG: two-component system response regulator DesR [Thalassolituus sp.]|jgi:two-component system response regulator DesR